MEKSSSKPNKEHDAQIAAQIRKDAEKEFKEITAKVSYDNEEIMKIYKYIYKSNLFLPHNLNSYCLIQMRADFEQEKKRAVNVATRSLERDLERLKADHATEMEETLEKNREEISEIKKKQWVIICFIICLKVLQYKRYLKKYL